MLKNKTWVPTGIFVSIAVITIGIILLNCSLTFAQTEDEMLMSFESQKLTVQGEIIKVKMSESVDPVPWEEMGIKAADGKIYILIGRAVENIVNSAGKQYLVKGMTKPSMVVKGEQVTVIELESAQILSDPNAAAK